MGWSSDERPEDTWLNLLDETYRSLVVIRLLNWVQVAGLVFWGEQIRWVWRVRFWAGHR